MSEDLIEIYNDVSDIVLKLNSLGFDSNRSAVQSLTDALDSLDDYIAEASLGEDEHE